MALPKFSEVEPEDNLDTSVDDQDVSEEDYEDSPDTNSDSGEVDEADSGDEQTDDSEPESSPEAVEKSPDADKTKRVKSKPSKDAKVETSAVTQEDYKVLYRRFRPSKFSEIMGQDDIVRALRTSVINNTVAGVYLFSGERGTGKTTTARVFASALNCPNVGSNGEPCGICDLCLSVHEGYGATGVTEHDAASNSSVDDMRRIIGDTQFARASNKNVYIIDEVHLLSNQANGSLLKTLEEPPPNVTFILCTTNPEKLAKAIRSRATIMNFRTLSDDKMIELLSKVAKEAGIEITEAQLAGVVRNGGGSPRDALSFLERVSLDGTAEFASTNNAAEITDAIADRSIPEILIRVANGIEDGKSATDLASELLAYWRTLLLLIHAPSLVKLSKADAILASDLANDIGTKRLIRMMTMLSETYGKMNQGDPRVILESSIIQFILPHGDAETISDISRQLDDVLDRIDEFGEKKVIHVADAFNTPAKSESAVWHGVDDLPEGSSVPEPSEKDGDEPPVEQKVAVQSSRMKIIENEDDLIDAIFEAAPKKLQLVIPDLSINHKKTTKDVLWLDAHKSISDNQWDQLRDAVAEVDPRDLELDEG